MSNYAFGSAGQGGSLNNLDINTKIQVQTDLSWFNDYDDFSSNPVGPQHQGNVSDSETSCGSSLSTTPSSIWSETRSSTATPVLSPMLGDDSEENENLNDSVQPTRLSVFNNERVQGDTNSIGNMYEANQHGTSHIHWLLVLDEFNSFVHQYDHAETKRDDEVMSLAERKKDCASDDSCGEQKTDDDEEDHEESDNDDANGDDDEKKKAHEEDDEEMSDLEDNDVNNVVSTTSFFPTSPPLDGDKSDNLVVYQFDSSKPKGEDIKPLHVLSGDVIMVLGQYVCHELKLEATSKDRKCNMELDFDVIDDSWKKRQSSNQKHHSSHLSYKINCPDSKNQLIFRDGGIVNSGTKEIVEFTLPAGCTKIIVKTIASKPRSAWEDKTPGAKWRLVDFKIDLKVEGVEHLIMLHRCYKMNNKKPSAAEINKANETTSDSTSTNKRKSSMKDGSKHSGHDKKRNANDIDSTSKSAKKCKLSSKDNGNK